VKFLITGDERPEALAAEFYVAVLLRMIVFAVAAAIDCVDVHICTARPEDALSESSLSSP
jgi:hypothetical protein